MLYLTPKGDNSSTQYDVIFSLSFPLRTTIREPFIGTNIHFPSRKPEGYYVLRHTVKTARRLTSTSFSHFSPGFYFSVHRFLDLCTVDSRSLQPSREIEKSSSYREFEANNQK